MPLPNKTSANVSAVLTIEDVAPAGFELSQFSTDAGVVADAVQEVQADMTLDGKLVAGYTPNPVVVTVTLQPTSPSLAYFREAIQRQRSENTVLECNLNVFYPSTGRTYRFVNGAITSSTPMPGANRVQGDLTYQLTFEKVY